MICQRCHARQASVFVTQSINGNKTELYLCEQCARESGTLPSGAPLNMSDFFSGLLGLTGVGKQAFTAGPQGPQGVQGTQGGQGSQGGQAGQGSQGGQAGQGGQGGQGSQGGQAGQGGQGIPGSPGNPSVHGGPGQVHTQGHVQGQHAPIWICDKCGMTFSDFQRTGKMGCSNCYIVFGDPMRNLLRRLHGSARHTGKVPAAMSEELKVSREIESLKSQLARAIDTEEYEMAAQLRDRIRELEV